MQAGCEGRAACSTLTRVARAPRPLPRRAGEVYLRPSAYLSAEDLAYFERLKRRERRAYQAGETPDEVLEAIEKAEYLQPGV